MEILLQNCKIDRNLSVPPALQLYRGLSVALKSRVIKSGSPLPSERKLCEMFNVSRVTLRYALKALESDGLLTAYDRSGWVFTDNLLNEYSGELISFTEMGEQQGFKVSALIFKNVIRPSRIDEADKLRIVPGSLIFELTRLRFLDDIPIAYFKNIVNYSLFKDIEKIDFSKKSLFSTFSQIYNIIPRSSLYSVQAELSDNDLSNYLKLKVGAPILHAVWITKDSINRNIEIGEAFYSGDSYKFKGVLGKK
jgi:GntR family transcriptional regulator